VFAPLSGAAVVVGINAARVARLPAFKSRRKNQNSFWASTKAAFLAVLVAAVLLAALARPASAQTASLCDSIADNPIRNCGGELGVTIWSPSGGGVYSTGNLMANSGIKGFLMNGGFGGPIAGMQQSVNLSAATYTLTFYYQPHTTGATITLAALWNGATVFSTSATANAAYARFSTTVTALAGANVLGFHVTSNNVLARTYYLDDISLVLNRPLASDFGQVTNASPQQTVNQSFSMLEMMTQFEGAPDRVTQDIFASGYAEERKVSRDAAAAYAALDRAAGLRDPREGRWQAWASGFGSQSKLSDGASGSNIGTRGAGTVAGAEYKASSETAFGFALGAAGGNWSSSIGSGSGKNNTFLIGAYARKRFDDNYVAGALNYGWSWTDSDRNDSGDVYSASYAAKSYGGRIEAGHRLEFGKLGFTPYASAQFQTVRLPQYSETAASGTGTNTLTYSSGNSLNTRTELGTWSDAKLSPTVKVFGKAAWANDHHSDPNVSVNFLTQTGNSIGVGASTMPRNIGIVTAGAEIALTNAVKLTAKFDGEFASGYRGYAGTGVLRYAFN
jgi:uncharacterized protein with beta-barrel porin domain